MPSDVAARTGGARCGAAGGGQEEFGFGNEDPRDQVPASVWRRFTPDVIESGKCLARTFNGGLGGQCTKLALVGSEFCRQHEGRGCQVHGFVKGPIPRGKLQHFLRVRSIDRSVSRSAG